MLVLSLSVITDCRYISLLTTYYLYCQLLIMILIVKVTVIIIVNK